MLREKIEQAKTFVKDHKKEILAVVCVVAGGAAVYKLVKSTPKIDAANRTMCFNNYTKELDIPELNIGRIDDLFTDNYGVNAIMNDFTVADMGKIGQELLKVDGVTNETVVTAVFGLLNENK